jgi:hypothetical protein
MASWLKPGLTPADNMATIMSPERTYAYRRVIKTLEDLGPSKLQESEQDRIRTAADTLIFSADLGTDVSALAAVDDVEQLCRALVECGRWEHVTALQLADDVRACGPHVPVLELRAA